jgi:hypothetical protein
MPFSTAEIVGLGMSAYAASTAGSSGSRASIRIDRPDSPSKHELDRQIMTNNRAIVLSADFWFWQNAAGRGSGPRARRAAPGVLLGYQNPAALAMPAPALLTRYTLLLQHLCFCTALVAELPRYPIEFPGTIVLHRAAGEPPFNRSAVKTCTLNRLRGFSLNTPGYAHGHNGANSVTATAEWLNESAVACHVEDSVTTAGNTSIVVDSGGSLCSTTLQEVCPGLYQAGPACWNCTKGGTDPAGHTKLKAAGCDKGAFKGYCGPQSDDGEDGGGAQVAASAEAGAKLCNSGPYTCAYFEHYAAFAPAFGRRPYFGETEGSVIVQTDFALKGQRLALSATVGGVPLFADGGNTSVEFEGGRTVRLPFALTKLPARISELVNITVAVLSSGATASKPRRFLRAPPPSTTTGISTIQVDHESMVCAGNHTVLFCSIF